MVKSDVKIFGTAPAEQHTCENPMNLIDFFNVNINSSVK